MRIVVGTIAGLAVAFLCVLALEMVGHSIYPPPPGLDISDTEQLRQLMAVMPTPAIALVALAWFVGALAGAYVADKIGRRALGGWIVALLVLAGGVATMVMIPHPAWMWAAGIALPLIAAWLAQRLAKVPL